VSIPAIMPGVTLVTSIVAYDLTHKLTSASVVLMGACRGFVCVTCAIAIAQPPEVETLSWMAGSLAAYVVVLSLVARGELRPRAGLQKTLALLMPLTALAPAITQVRDWTLWAIVTLILIILVQIHAGSILFRPSIRTEKAIMASLAAICVNDAFYTAILGQPTFTAISLGCFVLTKTLHRYIPGT
jgi:hypothetical protein